MSVQILLGPQTPHSNIRAVVDSLEVKGPIVCITAGWRDSEGEIEDLRGELGRPIEDLMIYHRAENVFSQEPELHALQRERQDKLVELQRLYRMRLTGAMSAARKLMRTGGDPELLRLEQRAAIAQVRALDRHHIRRIAAIHRQFDVRRAALKIPAAGREREDVQRIVAGAALVVIAGGHVAVLLNRIRLFRLRDLLAEKPVVAWSAGAMVLSERIVLFHDDAPQGKRDAEVLDQGLGVVRDYIPLPHADSRLDWSNPARMALFSRRFSPSNCCTLDNGSSIHLKQGRIVETTGSSVVTRTGRKKALRIR